MIFTYKELKRMLDFSEQHKQENIYLKVTNCGIIDVYEIQTQHDCWEEKDNLIDITDYDNV